MDTSAWYTRKKSNNGLSIRTRTKVIRRKHIIQSHRFRRLFLDLLFMGRGGCASAMGMIKFPSSCSSSKALCNQFIDYYICSRGVFCINHIKLRNFVIITIECSIATVDRGSIMTRIYRWSMMVYSSLQAEFMVTKYDGHIHRYGAIWYSHLHISMWKILIGENNKGNVFSHITLAGNYIFLNQYAPLIPHIFPSAFVLYLIRGIMYHGRMGGGGCQLLIHQLFKCV